LRELADRPEDVIALATDVGLTELLSEIRDALGVSARLARLFQRNKPRVRGAEAASLWNSVVNRTRSDDYRQWRYLIEDHREPPNTSGDETISTKLTHNLDADAKTLACIEALYRENPEALGPSPSKRFLFITSDAAILSASRSRAKSLRREGIPSFVRSPLVYNPLINFSAMHRHSQGAGRKPPADAPGDLREVFLQVEGAIAALFPSGELSGRTGGRRWARHWELQNNVRRWSEAAEKMGIVNAQLLIDELPEPEPKEVAAIFAKERIAEAAGGVITSRIAEIKQDHTLNMSAIAFEHIAKLLAKGDIKAKAEARAPTKIVGVDLLREVRLHIGPRFRGKTWTDLIDAIPNEDLPKIISAVANALRESWDDPQGQLLASSIYLGVQAWESAYACAQRCEEISPPGPPGRLLRREANYCRALSLRMMLRSEDQISEAERVLSRNIATNFVDPVVRLRDAVERATLLISACVVQAIVNLVPRADRPLESWDLVAGDLPSQFDDAVRELEDVVLRFGDEFSGQGHDVALVEKVVRQGAVNRLGAELLRHYLQGRLSNESPQLLRVLKETKATLDVFNCSAPLPHPVTRGYMEAARYEAGEIAQAEVLSTLKEIRESGLLTDADEVEFSFITSKVSRRKFSMAASKVVA